jgi:hypothetical protein
VNPWHRAVAIVIRCIGILDLFALAAVVVPWPWIEAAARWLGLSEVPSAPLVGYLARSASAMYAIHGAAVLFVSFDVARYWPMIRVMALIALVHGAIMVGIDFAEGMPVWWRTLEGPSFASTGVVVLILMNRAGDPAFERSPV